MLWLFLFVCLILWLCLLTRRDKRMELLYKQIPYHAPQLPILGHAYVFMGSGKHILKSIQTLGRETTDKGGLMGMWYLKTLYLMVTDADMCGYILKHCLAKGDIMKLTWIVLGNASIFAPVPIWRPRRRLHISNFNQRRLNGFVEIFSKHSHILVQKLKLIAGEEPHSVWKYLHANALDAVCESIMGTRVNAQDNPNHPFLVAVSKLFQLTAERISKPWLHSDFLCNLYFNYKEYKSTIFDFTEQLLKARRKLLEVNSQRREEDNAKKETYSSKFFVDNMINMMKDVLHDEQENVNLMLQEEVLLLIGAGTDTSSVASALTTVMLSRYPDVQEKMYQELQNIFGDSDRPVVVEDLSYLKYLEAVIKETMRLYPPVPIIERKVENDVTLPSGITLVKGCGIFINIWAANRNPLYWGADVDEFRPERFLEAPLTHPAAYLTFSYGLRGCIGTQFAYMLMKVTIANIVRHFRLLPAPDPATGAIPARDEPLKLTFETLAKHIDNYMVRLEKRSDVALGKFIEK